MMGILNPWKTETHSGFYFTTDDVIAMSLVYYFKDIGIKSLAIYFIE
jgi:hypothetical protein